MATSFYYFDDYYGFKFRPAHTPPHYAIIYEDLKELDNIKEKTQESNAEFIKKYQRWLGIHIEEEGNFWKMYVPQSYVGFWIGKKGKKIKLFQKLVGKRIKVIGLPAIIRSSTQDIFQTFLSKWTKYAKFVIYKGHTEIYLFENEEIRDKAQIIRDAWSIIYQYDKKLINAEFTEEELLKIGKVELIKEQYTAEHKIIKYRNVISGDKKLVKEVEDIFKRKLEEMI